MKLFYQERTQSKFYDSRDGNGISFYGLRIKGHKIPFWPVTYAVKGGMTEWVIHICVSIDTFMISKKNMKVNLKYFCGQKEERV